MEPELLLDELRRSKDPRLVIVPDPPADLGSVALLSGSFDPMTVAHEAMADAAAERVDLVVLTYSARTMPKDPGAPPSLLDERRRIESIKRFCARRAGFAVGLCSHGLLVDQVRAAQDRFRTALWTLMGSDKVLQVLDPSWYDDRDAALEPMLATARVLYAVRSGDAGIVERALSLAENVRWKDRFERLHVPPKVAGVSSRTVRQLVREGRDVTDLVPEEILEFLPSSP
jgi:nicotinic acid mononucleotide adenylyltransferase